MPWTLPKPIVLGGALVALAACGDSPPKPSTPATGPSTATGTPATPAPAPVHEAPKPPSVDACTLLTNEEAEAVGGALREAQKPVESLGPLKGCSWSFVDGSSVSLRVYGAGHWGMQSTLDADDPSRVVVPGLGDEAYFTKKGSDTDLWARKGGAVLNVNGSMGAEKTKAVAEKAIGKL